MALKVGIVGTGAVGTTLGKRLLLGGANVKYASRDPSAAKITALLEAQPTASVGTTPEVLKWADAVILATPGAHTDAAIQATAASLGPDIKGKVLIDATNPASPYPGLEVRWAQGTSAGEVLAEALPGTHVLKAFNTLGENLMRDPDGSTVTGQQLTLLIAGAAEGRAVAEQVVATAGFIPTYVGSIRYARNLEAIAELWIHLGVPGIGTSEKWGRNFHFQVLRQGQ